MKQPVGNAMTKDFVSVNPATKLTRVLQLMVEHRVRSIPVLGEEKELVGIISRQDIIKALWLYTGPTS
jgi:CBS domain-containing protein